MTLLLVMNLGFAWGDSEAVVVPQERRMREGRRRGRTIFGLWGRG